MKQTGSMRRNVGKRLCVLFAILVGVITYSIVHFLTGTIVFGGLALIIGFCITLILIWPKRAKTNDNQPPDEPGEE